MVVGRRALLRGAPALALGAAALGAAAPAPSWEQTDRARGWLAAWDAQGDHRTATGADVAAADWLSSEAAAFGALTDYELFDLNLLQGRDTYLEIGGDRVLGEMLYDAPPTQPAGVKGHLAVPGDRRGHIALVELAPNAVYDPGFAELRQRADLQGLVIVTHGGAPGLALLNAEAFRAPYGPPTLQVTSYEGPALRALAAQAAPATLMVTARRTPTNARNLTLRVAGRQTGQPPLVVLAARSAWWRSTGERGGAMVCWLEIVRALSRTPPNRDVVLLATSGHELGHLGLVDFLARRPGLAQQADWVHLGGNIGAAGGRLTLTGSSAKLRRVMARALQQAGQVVGGAVGAAPPAEAETREILRGGGAFVSITGTNRLFHLPQDRWPEAVDLPTVVRVAAAAARAVAELAGT